MQTKSAVRMGVLAAFAAFVLLAPVLRANSIPSRTNSSYGEPGPYTVASGLNTLTQGSLFVDPTPPAGFMEEVLCPISVGCSSGNPFALLIEPTAPAAGGGFQIDLGSNVGLADTGIALLTCDTSFALGTFCTPTPLSSPCLSEYSSTGNTGDHLLSVNYAKDAGCIPGTLVFSIDEDVATGSLPTFGTITPLVTAPEPASMLLLGSGLVGLLLKRRAQSAA
jgi:hypothetical protein